MTNYTPDDWAEIERLFDAVAPMPPDAARAWLEQQCPDRSDLRAEVQALLDAHHRPGLLVETDPPAGPSAPGVGDIVGPYRLTAIVGQGGMGTVYRADRLDGAFSQPVAIKIGSRPMADPVAARRVRAEREILAALRHPHIVSLLDAGVTGGGFPYLVMEYVEGVPITEFCRERALPLSARLDLFRQVCAAVHHAHRHAVVHRDLKPDNILVTADGIPKVLDFGIARLLAGAPAGADGALTREGTGPLTPNYASPEQVRGVPLTTSSDIYALGVLLYEMVTGARPYEANGKPFDEVVRLVVERDPMRPSTRAAGPGVPYDLRHALAGDLDAILLCAMAKEPERRYPSAADLAADLRRHLAALPVAAREPTLSYVIRRLARRHTAAMVLAAVATLVVLAALGVTVWQARVARTERDRARAEATKAQTMTRFLGRVFSSANPTQRTGPVTVRDLLDQGARSIETELADQPDVQAELLFIMAGAYERLAGEDVAAALLDRARQRWEATGDTTHERMYRALHLSGRVMRRRGQPRAAVPLLERALALGETIHGANAHAVALTLRELALARAEAGDVSLVAPLFERAIAIEQALDPAGATLANLYNAYAGFHRDQLGDFPAARRLLEQSMHLYAARTGPERWERVLPMLNLADLLRMDEDLVAADALFVQALAVDDETFGRESPGSAYTLSRLGDVRVARGDLAGGRRLIEEALAIYGRLRPSDSFDLAAPYVHLARLHLTERRMAEAAETFARAVRLLQARHGMDHHEVTRVLAEEAAARLAAGDAAAAEALARRALAAQRRTWPAEHRGLVPTLVVLARALKTQGRHDEVAALADEAVRIARAVLPERHSARVGAQALLAGAASGRGPNP